MIEAGLREWLCVEGHIFYHNAAVPEIGADILEVAETAVINSEVHCPCGATSVMEFPLGEISNDNVYPLVRRDPVVVPAGGLYYDSEGRVLQEGDTVVLEVRNVSTLMSALELGEGP